jgi:hypothetical protein
VSLHHARKLLDELDSLGIPCRVEGDRVQLPSNAPISNGLYRRLKRARRDLRLALAERYASPSSAATRQRPSRPCYACRGLSFWTAGGKSEWVCARCHPSDRAPGDLVWHEVEGVTEREVRDRARCIGCPECRGSGALLLSSSSWTVCPRCNSGFYSDDVPPYGDARKEGGGS